MKKLIIFISTILLTFGAFAQSNEDYFKIGSHLTKAIERFENYKFEEYEKPELYDIKPVQIDAPKTLTKEEIVADMNYLWWRLFEEERTVVLIDGDIDSIEFDYSGETLYVLFSDEMFNSPRWTETIAYYACRKDAKYFPTTPKYSNGVFPLIVVRNSATNLDEYIYYEYMRDVLAHEMLHYALNRYEDFDIDHQHDETFLVYANGWNKEFKDLDIEIKPYASQFEVNMLIR